jgi:Wnt-binding factor required for Wnt secretion
MKLESPDLEFTLKLHLESSSKSKISVISGINLIFFFICLIVALTIAPTIVDHSSVTFESCRIRSNVPCFADRQFDGFNVTFNVKKFNQLIYFDLGLGSTETIAINLNFNYTLYGVSDGQSEKINTANITTSVNCKSNNCNNIMIFYLPYVFYDHYYIIIIFNDDIPADSMTYTMYYINKEFTKFELGVKYFFLTLSIISYAYFLFNVLRIPFRFWSFETKLVGCMGISLIIFNEPLLVVTLNQLNEGWSGLSVFSNVQFVGCLILFWMYSLQHYSNFKCKTTIFFIEVILVSTLFGLLIAVYLYATVNFRYNPNYYWENDFSSSAKSAFIVGIVLLVGFAAWILILSVLSVVHYTGSSFRAKIFRFTNFIVMSISFVAIGIGAFQPVPRAASMILIFGAFFNFYFMLLQWIFTPAYSSYCNYLDERKSDMSAHQSKLDISKYTDEIKKPNKALYNENLDIPNRA